MADATKYQRGSFNGVKFLTENMKTRFGRRAAVYELPFDESGVAHFDLGRAPRRYSIRALILSNDQDGYMPARNKLIAELEKGGAGRLVHPSLGQVMVVIQNNIDIEESTAEGNCCTISFEAIEARDPVPAESGKSLLDAANELRLSASEAFIKALNSLSGPDVLFQDAFSTLDDVNRSLTRLNAKIGSWLEAPGNLASSIDRISQNLATLINTPERLFSAIDGFFESVCASISRVSNAATRRGVAAQVQHSAMRRALRGFGTMDSDSVAIPAVATPTREQQRRNRADIVQALKASAYANLASALAELPPESRSEALDIAGSLASELAELADGNMDGEEVNAEMYQALKALASEVERMTDTAGAEGVVQLAPLPDTVPAVVLAFRIWGDSERADDLLARNKHLLHPGAIQPSESVEVLAPEAGTESLGSESQTETLA